jgi:hypothetical protein
MQEQIKKKSKKSLKFNKKKYKAFIKRKNKGKARYMNKVLRQMRLSGWPLHYKVCSAMNDYAYYTFQVYPNNVFCTLKVLKNSKFYLLNQASSGKYNIKLSKKTIKYKLKFVIFAFLKEVRSIQRKKKISLPKSTAIKIIAPRRIKSTILRLLKVELKRKKRVVIEVLRKHVFNGCRARKKIRKKRKGITLFK